MLRELLQLRHDLHRHPERSGREFETMRRLDSFFAGLNPDRVVSGIGGTGLAIVFECEQPAPTVLLRAELDALPIHETSEVAHASVHDGLSHACGHDGHMAILAGVGKHFARERLATGRLVLLFQPAEETGQGARQVVDDSRFAKLAPEFAFALHNLPGYARGQIIVRDGTMCCASRGMTIRLKGRTAHAAHPETGINPTGAVAQILAGLPTIPACIESQDEEAALLTIVGARIGDRAFGIAPGDAEVHATLRTGTDATMRALIGEVEQTVRRMATEQSLQCEFAYDEIFPATVNAESAVGLVKDVANRFGLAVHEPDEPFRSSEDFGRLTTRCPVALFGFGAGVDSPPLHDSSYDFCDELIEPAVGLLVSLVDACVSREQNA